MKQAATKSRTPSGAATTKVRTGAGTKAGPVAGAGPAAKAAAKPGTKALTKAGTKAGTKPGSGAGAKASAKTRVKPSAKTSAKSPMVSRPARVSGAASLPQCWVGLLRAVNVGGTGKLPMADLRAMCEALGFSQVRTYIASGNVVFRSALDESQVKLRLESALADYAGRPVGVLVRSPDAMQDVLAANPFPQAAPNRVLAIFLDAAPPPDALQHLRHQVDEQLALGRREIYVHYGEGMAQSRLVIPAARHGTARNLNTIAKLAAMAREPG